MTSQRVLMPKGQDNFAYLCATGSMGCSKGIFKMTRMWLRGSMSGLHEPFPCVQTGFKPQHGEIWLDKDVVRSRLQRKVLAALLWIFKKQLSRYLSGTVWIQQALVWGNDLQVLHIFSFSELVQSTKCVWMHTGSGGVFANMSLTWNSKS